MRTKRVLPWLPLGALPVCLVLVRLSVHGACALVSWLCDERSLVLDLMTMGTALLLVVIGCVGWGISAAAVQWYRTRQMLHQLAALPRRPLPASLHDLVLGLGLVDKLDVLDDAGTEVLCYGLFRPRIYVTAGLLATLSEDELEAVLRHERHHLLHRDPLRSLLWTVLDTACWWAAPSSEQAHLRRELAADRAAIEAGQRLPLARALLKLLEGGAQPRHTRLAVSGLSVTEARIEQLLERGQNPAPALVWTHHLLLPAVAVVAALACSIIMARL